MQVVDRGTIYDASQAPAHARFCTFPSPVRLADGRIVVAFRTGSAKDSADEDIYLRVSTDEGKTWHVVRDGFGDVPPSGGRIRALGLTELAPGRLIGSFMWLDHSDPTLPLANPETQGILPSRVMVAESPDAGKTWSDLREVPVAPHTGNAITGSIMELYDGTLALPYEAWKDYYDTATGAHHAALRLSTDGGETWSGRGITAHDPTARVFYWDQRVTVDPNTGRLIAMFWSHDRTAQQDLPMHIAWGDPDGIEWSEPISTAIPGQIASPLVLPDGRVFAAYVHRHAPPSLRCILSDDFGRTWAATPELVFYEKQWGGQEFGMVGSREFGEYWSDMNVWTFGHAEPVLLGNGDVMVVYYAGDATALSICWVRIAV